MKDYELNMCGSKSNLSGLYLGLNQFRPILKTSLSIIESCEFDSESNISMLNQLLHQIYMARKHLCPDYVWI